MLSASKFAFRRSIGIQTLSSPKKNFAWRSYCKTTAPLLAPSEVKVMYGSQTGTAQMLAMQLADELMASSVESVKLSSLHDCPPPEMIEKGADANNSNDDALIFVVSCCGVGQPSDTAREFATWLQSSDAAERGDLINNRNYAVFGLGNAKTHSENYNIVGKKLDARMEELGAKRIHPLGLGDDSGCIEDDFDTWSQALIETLNDLDESIPVVTSAQPLSIDEEEGDGVCLVELAAKESEGISLGEVADHPPSKFPKLVLDEVYPEDRDSKKDMFDIDEKGNESSEFYMPGTQRLKVIYNKQIAPNRESLHEVGLSLEDHPDMTYEVGDHLWIYAQNHPSQVLAYARAVQTNLFSIIKGVEGRGRPYPFPLNLTVSETLQHCVDLSALPSPSLTRFILGRKVDYKSYVAEPRRTALDLLLEPGSRKLTLGELIYQLTPMSPRYYSISSSSTSHPREVYMTYRPVKYLSTRGVLREGLCTSYLNATRPAYDDDEDGGHARVFVPYVAAGIRSNPEFRLPEDPSIPLILVAGGCGIAPIRSFLDDRLAHAKRQGKVVDGQKPFGDAHLFFGVRNDDDEVYHALIEHSLTRQTLTSAHISHSSSCTNPRFVANDIDDASEAVFDCLERGAHVFLCGGAVGFAPTCAAAIKRAIANHGHMSAEEAEEYYMNLVRGGRYAEDISA